MNKIENKINFKTLFMFFIMLVLSLSMAFATACGDGSSESTSTSEESSSVSVEEALDDEQLFANGDFEHPTNKYPSTAPITLTSSSTKWTGSVDGEVGFQVSSTNVARGIIDVSEEAFAKLKGNSTYSDAVNPGTPVTNKLLTDNADTEANEAGTRVLMLKNKELAAQYVTSATTLSVPAGKYGKLTLWVYTDIQETVAGTEAGAYIKVKNTVTNPDVEGATYDPLVIENINTKVTEGEVTKNVWKQYTLYLVPNANKATSFTLVLGLGEGNKLDIENHVKGYAFFDNVIFELVDTVNDAEAPALPSSGKATHVTVTTDTDGNFTVNGRVDSKDVVEDTVVYSLVEDKATSMKLGAAIADNNAKLTYPNDGVAAEYVTYDDAKDELVIDFSSRALGAAYTYASNEFTLKGGEYARVSLWAKINAEEHQTKATIALYDVALGKDVAVFENAYTTEEDGFARYTFYIANNFFFEDASLADLDYQLKISFGPTKASSISDVKLLPTGIATFKNLEIEYLSKENYDLANVTTDARAKKGTLIGSNDGDFVAPEEDEEEDETTDSYNVTVNGGYDKIMLEKGEIIPLSGLSSSNLVQSEDDNTKFNVGVVNSKYSDKYNETVKAALGATKEMLTEMAKTEKNVNKDVQALLVHNISGGSNFVSGSVISIPQNSTYVFSIRVYAHDTAKAFARLVDIDDRTNVFKNFGTKIDNATSKTFEDGFATVTFIITTGFENYDLRLEFGVEGAGVALFQSIATGSVNANYVSFESVESAFNADNVYAFATKNSIVQSTYHYSNESDAGNLSAALKNEDGSYIVDTSAKKYTQYGVATLANSDVALIVYERLNLDDRYVIDVDEDEEEEVTSEKESTEEVEGGENYGWLQVTSIIIALALVAALVAVVVRKATENKNKKRKNTEKYYQGFDKNKFSKSNDVAVPDEDEKAKDYDYDNPENN